MSRSVDGVWSDRLRCDDREYALDICEHLNSIIEVRNENMRLRALVEELLPFMHYDVDQGLQLGPAPSEHPNDDCSDCKWYAESLKWKARIDAGEFADFHYVRED